MEFFGHYKVTLEKRYVGPGPHTALMALIGGLGTGVTLGFGALFVPAGEYRYELAATLSFFDCNGGFVQKFTASRFLDVTDSLARTRDYTKKGEHVYRKLLEECQRAAGRVAGDINAALIRAKYPPPPPMEIAVEKAFEELTADIPAGGRIALLGVDPAHSCGGIITDYLERLFIQSKKFQILDRRNIENVLNELQFGRSVFVDSASAIEAGNILSATIIIVGNISGEGTNRMLIMRAISVATSEVLAVASQRF
jgi:hypothetical protein